MSDHSITIVPRRSDYPGHLEKAKEILEWLVSRDIVKPVLSDCILSADKGYAISGGAAKVTTDPASLPFDLVTNGLEITTQRQIFDPGESGIEELICPACHQDISSEDWSFLDNWSEGQSNNLVCPLCHTGTDIQKFNFKPVWGFSNLGFTFWNWPELTEDFLNEFQQKLACPVSVVYQHI